MNITQTKSSKSNRLTISHRKMKFVHSILIFALVIIAVKSTPAPLKNDPKRPVDKIAADLGITSTQFIECFNDVTPAVRGSTPSSDQVHSNKQHLLTCLQKSNSGITNDILDAVMDKYRPSS